MVRTRCMIAMVAALVLSGCATPQKADPRDPEVWRPLTPARYPEPK